MFNLIMLFPKSEDFFGDLLAKEDSFKFPEIQLKDEKDKIRLFADMPGYTKDNIDVEVIGNLLSISAENRDKKEKRKKDSYSYQESYHSFHRTFDLGDKVDAKNGSVDYKDGKLEVELPKIKKSKKEKDAKLKVK